MSLPALFSDSSEETRGQTNQTVRTKAHTFALCFCWCYASTRHVLLSWQPVTSTWLSYVSKLMSSWSMRT